MYMLSVHALAHLSRDLLPPDRTGRNCEIRIDLARLAGDLLGGNQAGGQAVAL